MDAINLPEMNKGTNANSIVLPAMKYLSGGREWLAITISFKVLGKFVNTSAVKKKNQEVIKKEIRNRFLDAKHKNDIKEYIKSEERYTIPPITLVSYEQLPFRPYLFDDADKKVSNEELLKSRGSILGLLYLPIDYEFECLDGNHRTVAIRELASENPELIADSHILLNIVYESDDRKIRQDFVDVNSNAKPTTSSINTLFNTRDLVSGLVADVIDNTPYLNETTELLATSVSKNSKDIYTINNVKNTIIEIAGYNSQGSTSTKIAENLKNESYRNDLLMNCCLFYKVLSENRFIHECLTDRDKTPEIRNLSVITSGTGIVIAARVAGFIFNKFKDEVALNSELYRLLQKFDWSRNNVVFSGKVVFDDKILNSRDAISSTTQAIKYVLGYSKEEQISLEEQMSLN